MGLRERNAARTRELLVDSALALFEDRGYDATTMEDVAERAEVSASTLYRYFPSKDRLLIDPLSLRGHLAATVRERADDEPLAVTLGHAIRAIVLAPRAGRDLEPRIHAVLQTAAAPRARLHEEFVAERTLLAEAIAERLGREPDDLYCTTTARLATTVLEIVGERARTAPVTRDHDEQVLQIVADVLDQLTAEPPTLPELGRG